MKTVVFGLQYGDEGKGKVASWLAPNYQWSVRFNGGPNAGHTVYRDNQKYALHQLPGGVLSGHSIALDAGMVIDTGLLMEELNGLPACPEIFISSRAHVILSQHAKEDAEGSGIGTTKKGIAYAYRDKALRLGKRMADYRAWAELRGLKIYEGLAPFKDNDNVLFESAQGVMLDIDYGCYPYVTSSSVMPNGYYNIDNRIGVMKAYVSRVGDGPPNREKIDWLTEKGQEYGTTTGRPRKCYWNDAEELDYAIGISKPQTIVLTKLDILKDACDWGKIWFSDYGKNHCFHSTENYLDFLTERYPQIKYYSDTPLPEMKEI